MTTAVCLALKADGMTSVNPSHPGLKTLLESGATVDSFVQAARDMRERKTGSLPSNPFAYVIGTVRNQMQHADDMATAAIAGASAGGKSPKTTTKLSEKTYVGGVL